MKREETVFSGLSVLLALILSICSVGCLLTGFSLQVQNLESGEMENLACDGLFVSIGRKPATSLVKGQLNLDDNGYIIAGEDTKTNLPGVFAIGDVRTKSLRQIVTAVADGAMAVHSAEEYLTQL